MPQDTSATQMQGRSESGLEGLDVFGVQFLVVDARRDSDLLQAARTHPAWTIDFEDGESVLFARARMPEPAEATT